MKKYLNFIFDFYYNVPIIIDAFIIGIVWIINSNYAVFDISIEINQINSICSSIIDTSVSMAGFILAALTIIVTFKSNITAKGIDESKNPLEMILASPNYKNIIYTFKSSIVELTIVFIVLYITSVVKGELSDKIQFNILISAILLLIFSLARSLYLLFRILKMEK